jgi:hypothetical protein
MIASGIWLFTLLVESKSIVAIDSLVVAIEKSFRLSVPTGTVLHTRFKSLREVTQIVDDRFLVDILLLIKVNIILSVRDYYHFVYFTTI